MSRQIRSYVVSTKDMRGSASEGTSDAYMDRLMKYIPGEVVAVYVCCKGIIEASPPPDELAQILVFVILTFATPLYLKRFGKVKSLMQLGISTISFVVWVCSLGGPTLSLHLPPLYAALLLPLFTFGVALIEPTAPNLPPETK